MKKLTIKTTVILMAGLLLAGQGFAAITADEAARLGLVNERLIAVHNYALLANKDEAATLSGLIAAEPRSEDGGYREKFAENQIA